MLCVHFYVTSNVQHNLLCYYGACFARHHSNHEWALLHPKPPEHHRLSFYGAGGVVAQSAERATPGEEVLGSIPAVAARPYWLGQCQYNGTGCDRSHGLPALSHVWHHLKLSDVSLGARPRLSLVFDEDVKKPTNQTNRRLWCHFLSSSRIPGANTRGTKRRPSWARLLCDTRSRLDANAHQTTLLGRLLRRRGRGQRRRSNHVARRLHARACRNGLPVVFFAAVGRALPVDL